MKQGYSNMFLPKLLSIALVLSFSGTPQSFLLAAETSVDMDCFEEPDEAIPSPSLEPIKLMFFPKNHQQLRLIEIGSALEKLLSPTVLVDLIAQLEMETGQFSIEGVNCHYAQLEEEPCSSLVDQLSIPQLNTLLGHILLLANRKDILPNDGLLQYQHYFATISTIYGVLSGAEAGAMNACIGFNRSATHRSSAWIAARSHAESASRYIAAQIFDYQAKHKARNIAQNLLFPAAKRAAESAIERLSLPVNSQVAYETAERAALASLVKSALRVWQATYQEVMKCLTNVIIELPVTPAIYQWPEAALKNSFIAPYLCSLPF